MKSNHSFSYLLAATLFVFASCSSTKKASKNEAPTKTVTNNRAKTFTKPLKIDRNEFVKYAKTFLGKPYKYGSSTPANGLDCSGFILVVFAHFDVKAPRTSKDFTNEGLDIDLKNAKAGDIILFTGSDNSTGIVGHMGIITVNNSNGTQFISSTSGKNIGVVESKLIGYWKTHFVKVIRLLAP